MNGHESAGFGKKKMLGDIILPLFLFLLTILTTVTAGTFFEGIDPFKYPKGLIRGIPFSASLLFILGTHELGHYFASKSHRVLSTLPFFIPGPPIPPMIGTFGAVIKMKSPITTRKALVDIGSAGPLIGFISAVIVTVWGLKLSTVGTAPPAGSLNLGASLIFEFLSRAVAGPVPEGMELFLHPVAFAGWIGLFVTSLNLLPIGQLDGGHIVYAVFGPAHIVISILSVAALAVLGIYTWPGWLVWGALVTLFGLRHPPVVDPYMPLSKGRRVISILTLTVFVLTFMPSPFYIG